MSSTAEAPVTTIAQERLVQMVSDATQSVFSTMLDMQISPGEVFLQTEALGPPVGLMAMIGFAGRWRGTGSIACNATLACKIADALFMSEHSSIEDEVLDAIAEAANMILGGVKTELEDAFGPMLLSIPTVVYGRNFNTRSLGKKEWLVVPFETCGERLEVRLCLEPGELETPEKTGGCKFCSLHL